MPDVSIKRADSISSKSGIPGEQEENLKTRDSNVPTVGLVVPYRTATLPPEALRLYPSGVNFVPAPATVESLDARGYDLAVRSIIPAAESLAEAGADAIFVRGTSLTFYHGVKAHRKLVEDIVLATGLPVSTLSQGVVDGLRAVNAKTISVLTAYTEDVTSRLLDFLRSEGFVIKDKKIFDVVEFDAVRKIGEEVIAKAVIELHQRTPDVDAILISCGGLRTIDITVALEAQIGLPVISSNTAGIWSAVRLVGHSGRSPGFGKLFEIGKE